jgi:hypothetical protein
MLEEKVVAQGVNSFEHVFFLKLARFGLASSDRLKEGDVACNPKSCTFRSDWSSIMIEVGVLESLSGLLSDAHYWITKSGGQTHKPFK